MSTPPLTMGAATSEKSWTARTASENKSSIAFVIVAPCRLPASGRGAGARAQAKETTAASRRDPNCNGMVLLVCEAAAAIAALSQLSLRFWLP